MPKFSFNAHGVNINASSEQRKGLVAGRKTFTAQAKCPICQREFKSGYGIGDVNSESEAKSTLKSNMKAHVKKFH